MFQQSSQIHKPSIGVYPDARKYGYVLLTTQINTSRFGTLST